MAEVVLCRQGGVADRKTPDGNSLQLRGIARNLADTRIVPAYERYACRDPVESRPRRVGPWHIHCRVVARAAPKGRCRSCPPIGAMDYDTCRQGNSRPRISSWWAGSICAHL